MSELLRLDLVTSDDVLTVRQLAWEMAREAGIGSLGQTRLAISASELARRSLLSAGSAVARFELEPDPSGPKLVIIISDQGPIHGGGEGSLTIRTSPGAAVDHDLTGLPELVDELEVVTAPDGSRSARLAMELTLTPQEHPAVLAGRLTSITVRDSVESLARRNAALAHALDLVRTQSEELAAANAELLLANDLVASTNAELAITNTGVISLNSELNRRATDLALVNDQLEASADKLKELGEQQAALAELGRLAIASTDAVGLAHEVVSRVRNVLGVEACAVYRFEADTAGLSVVAADGCGAPPAQTLDVDRASYDSLRRDLAGVRVVDLPADASGLPIRFPEDARSGVMVGLQTTSGPWGFLAACDRHPGRFTPVVTPFIEAASSLLAFQVSRTASEDAARHAAGHDALTGLANRATFMERLAAAVGDEAERLVGAVFIDLEDFKEINDLHGHHVGDELLLEVARRLRSSVRPDDIVARLGGDEFAVLVDGMAGPAAIERAATRVHEALGPRADLGVAVVKVPACIGWATSEGERNPAALLRRADLAMYTAKGRGKNAIVAFEPAMLNAVAQEALRADQLRTALDRHELVVYFQPVVDLLSGQISGAEALLRWADPRRGLLGPADFLALAEHIGLMSGITTWVLGEACRFAKAQAPGAEGTPFVVAVNVTAGDIEGGQLASAVESALANTGLPARQLCLEVTESGVLAEVPVAVSELAKVRAHGVAVAIDDFGTGYSSLSKLKHLAVDLVKIDYQFVDGLGTELDDSAVVAAIITMAHGLSLGVVAEGVETIRQLDVLCELGCDYAQGFLLGRPAPSTAPLPHHHVRQRLGSRVPAEPSPPPHLLTVVVADDLEDDRRLLRRSLTRSGRFIVVDEAQDGLRAVELAQQLHPDLLLLDLQMPVLDGLSALSRIRAEAPTTSVIVLSGHASVAAEQAAMETGALGCIAKGSANVVPDLLRILEAAGRT